MSSCKLRDSDSVPAAFGASLASEVRPYGIDVLVFHPSPVATRFYDKASPLHAPASRLLIPFC